jgi:hypothetical protein
MKAKKQRARVIEVDGILDDGSGKRERSNGVGRRLYTKYAADVQIVESATIFKDSARRHFSRVVCSLDSAFG